MLSIGIDEGRPGSPCVDQSEEILRVPESKVARRHQKEKIPKTFNRIKRIMTGKLDNT